MKTVSVIIPVYNAAEYLSECIESIRNQTLSNIEIILINDGSADGSEIIAAGYADLWDNIRLINQKNAGPSAARNRGLSLAAGKYVYFMDSDDLLLETALEELWTISEKEHLDLLVFAAEPFYESEELKRAHSDFDNSYLRKGSYEQILNGKDLLAGLRSNGDYCVSVCLQFMRREYLIRNGIRFYEGIVHEDNLFTFEATIKAERARCINDIYYRRRVRSDSIMTQQKTEANLRGYFISCMEHIKIAAAQDCTQEQRAQILIIIRSLIKWVERLYFILDEIEIEKFKEKCSQEERYLFEGILVPYFEEVKYLDERYHYEIEQGTHLVRKAKTVRRVLRQEGMRGFLRLIGNKIVYHLKK